MADGTGIQWTDATWGPIRGCSRVSEGCRHCYAETMAGRFGGPGMPYEGLVERKLKVISDDEQRLEPRWTGEVRFVAERLADPLRWRKPRRIFVNSMSDLFHEKLTNEQIAAVFGVMAAAPQHTFQCLTKRPKRMRDWFTWVEGIAGCVSARLGFLMGETVKLLREVPPAPARAHGPRGATWPLSNVWLGVSIENQAAADERIPDLLATPAALRFLSCEPLLEGIRLHEWFGRESGLKLIGAPPGIRWLIAGCESGRGARTCEVAWLQSLRDQCGSASVPFFLKQAAPTNGSLASDAPRPAPIDIGAGSAWKQGAIIGLPYLDGVQHAAFPEVVA